jgi:prepilin-type N-terminal cleavage/methylation domain-containing protein
MKINRPNAGDNRQGAKDAKWGKEKSFPWRSWPLGGLNSGFTMVEIAISLAVIGIALISIIGVLPIGMHTQRDNREETIVNQDATVLLEAIRSGARGLDDLTNYVYAITNYWTEYNANGGVIAGGGGINNGYTFANSSVAVGYYYPPPGAPITNGATIVGLLSTPEYVESGSSGMAIPTLIYGGYSNHVVAYVRSISGPAIEKPPQTNDIVVGDSFGYRVLCVNAPVATDTNIFINPWQPQQSYNTGDRVMYNWSYWQATANTSAGEKPGQSSIWAKISFYPLELAANLHELRLTFLWPQLPNGNVGPGRQTFRAMVAGQIAQTNTVARQILYFYQSQSFTTAP